MTAVVDLPNLAHLAAGPNSRGGRLETTWDEYRHIIGAHIAAHERSLQTRIGPSGLGIDCLKCLARKLAGIPERRGEDWLPFVGTCVHTGLADAFNRFNAERPGMPARFLTELEVSVGAIDGVNITGHMDLYDIVMAEVTDWKIVGVTTQRAIRVNGPPAAYRAQLHLYGLGAMRRGLPVDTVRLALLPRNAATLANSVIWTEPFNPSLAMGALDRANAFVQAATASDWATLIDSLPAEEGCYSCPRYPLPDGTYPKPNTDDPFVDLIGQ